MALPAICLFAACVLAMNVPSDGIPVPDSADLIPLPGPGLAYGGIPYGSVSGMLNSYFGGPYQLPAAATRRSFGGGNDLQHL